MAAGLVGRSFFKVTKGVMKKPRATAKRALPLWKQNRKKILEQEGKNIKGVSQRSKVGATKLPQKSKARHHRTVSTFTRKVAKGRVGGSVRKEDKNISFKHPVSHAPKPRITVTNKQWKLLMERVVKRQPTGQASLDPSAEAKPMIDSVMGQAPAVEKNYGRLYEPIQSGQEMIGKQPRDYQLPEAMGRYMNRGNEPLTAHKGPIPPADVLSTQGGKVSYERRNFVDVPTESVHRSEAAAVDVGADLKKRKVLTQAEKSAGKVEGTGTGAMPAEKLVKKAMILDSMWKFIGGGRSTTGRLWKQYSKTAKGRRKVQDPRDYFIRSGLRWMDDPEKYSKTAGRESRSLDTIWKEFQAEYGMEM